MFPDALGSVTRMISSLAIVIGLILVLMALFKKLTACGTPLGKRFSLIRLISSTSISPKKSIALVEIAGEIMAVGITSQQISLLGKIESNEAKERIRAVDGSKGTIRSFREHLDGVVPRQFRWQKKWKKSAESA